MYSLDPFKESAYILAGGEDTTITSLKDAQLTLEDATSPVRNNYIESLYKSVLDRGHIDFDDIPESKGDIKKYKGYQTMKDTLTSVKNLATSQNAKTAIDLVNVVEQTINILEAHADCYEAGFKANNEYIMLEYNTYVYTCVEATSSILYMFVDYIRKPDTKSLVPVLTNNKTRADAFHIDQLRKFNSVVTKMNYRSFLEGLMKPADKNNFIGTATTIGALAGAVLSDQALGIAAVAAVAIAIIPITRELIFQFYSAKAKLSDALAQQAYFLEMNKAAVEANVTLKPDKKIKVLQKQEKVRNLFLKLSSKLRVQNIAATRKAKSELDKENKTLNMNKIKQDIEDSPLTLA